MNYEGIKENYILEFRAKRNLLQKDLADAIKAHQTSVSAWEKQKGQPRPAQVIKLLDYFGCKMEDLFVQ